MKLPTSNHAVLFDGKDILGLSPQIVDYFPNSDIQVRDLPSGAKLISLSLLTRDPTKGLLKILSAPGILSVQSKTGATKVKGRARISDHPSTKTILDSEGRLNIYYELS